MNVILILLSAKHNNHERVNKLQQLIVSLTQLLLLFNLI